MTREQNIKAILETNFSGFKEEVIDIAVKKIIEIESCGDAISRQAVLDMLHDINAEVDDGCGFTYADWMDYIEQLPPVKQQPCNDAISRQAAIDALDCINGVEEVLKSLPPVEQKQAWIPVSERLPENEQEILFSTKTGRVHSGRYHDDDSANPWYSHRDKARAWNNVVTAWMPLPEPYKASPTGAEGSDKE